MKEHLDYLVTYLLQERGDEVFIPQDFEEEKQLYKALCNIREPKEVCEEYLEIEKKYLQEELSIKGVVDAKSIPFIQEHISLWQGDITRLQVDAIVNPANSQGLGCFNPEHRCLDNLIGLAAGLSLRQECDLVMKPKHYFLDTGDVFLTKGYNLPAKYVIHTVGPIIRDTVRDIDREKLRDCYLHSLELAQKNGIRSIAFPCISTGLFHFPKEEASIIAVQAVKDYLKEHPNDFEQIIFCVYSDFDYRLYEKQLEGNS